MAVIPSILEADAGGPPGKGQLELPMQTLPQPPSPEKEIAGEHRRVPRAGKMAQLLACGVGLSLIPGTHVLTGEKTFLLQVVLQPLCMCWTPAYRQPPQ